MCTRQTLDLRRFASRCWWYNMQVWCNNYITHVNLAVGSSWPPHPPPNYNILQSVPPRSLRHHGKSALHDREIHSWQVPTPYEMLFQCIDGTSIRSWGGTRLIVGTKKSTQASGKLANQAGSIGYRLSKTTDWSVHIKASPSADLQFSTDRFSGRRDGESDAVNPHCLRWADPYYECLGTYHKTSIGRHLCT